MKPFLHAILAMFLATTILGWQAPAQGQEEDYTYGTFVKAAGDTITIKEYDFESGDDVEVVYKLDKEIKLHGIKAIAELEIGEYVELSFIKKGNDRTALMILVEEMVEEEA